MGRRIEVNTHLDHISGIGISVDIDTYGILMYYAYTINQDKALQLYKATTSQYFFRKSCNLPLNGYNELNFEVYIPLNELQEVINFINNDVIPNLQLLSENVNIVDKWSFDNIHVFLRNQGSFFEYFNIDGDNLEGFTPEYLIELFTEYALIFSYAITHNSTHNVFFE